MDFVAIENCALAIVGQFSSLLSFFSIPDLKRLGLGMGVVTAGLLMMWNINDVFHQMSRGLLFSMEWHLF